MINRFIKKIAKKYLNFFPILGILGPRQVGKTTLVKQFLTEELEKEYLYLDLELDSDLNKLRDPELYLTQNLDKCVIIDEIQRMPSLFPLLRALIDKNRIPERYIILGSASPKILKDSSESLAGRVGYVELTPFNYLEIKDLQKLNDHWFKGGFPNSLLSNSENSKIWLDSFITTYAEKDFNLMGLNTSSIVIRNLWTMLAQIHGNILNISNLSKSLALSSPTISRYLDFFEGAFLIRRLYVYSVNMKKRLVKAPKIYIRDSGILHRLLGVENFDNLFSNILIGSSWEGYVIEQIIQLVNKDYTFYYYRTHDGAEVDLVICKAEKPIATVEVKFTTSPKVTKSQAEAIKDLNAKQNFIVGYNSDDYLIKENIRICSLETFLEKYLPKLNS